MRNSEYLGLLTFTIWIAGFFYNGPLFILLHCIGAYYSFITVHDASHRSASKWFGRLSSIPLFIPFDEFAVLHRLHHQHTNNEEKDPDFIMQRVHPIIWFFAPEVYVYHYAKLSTGIPMIKRIEGLCRYLFFISLFLVFTKIMGFSWSFAHLILPSRSAFAMLVYLLDVLPHRDLPEKGVRNLWNATRAPRWLEIITQNQCYHEHHHRKPHVPTLLLNGHDHTQASLQ